MKESKRKKLTGIIIIIALILGCVAAFFFVTFLIDVYESRFKFEIVSHNGVLGYESFYPEIKYNYTVFAEVKHVLGDSNIITFYCELTREDLTKIIKQKTVSLQKGETEVIEFFFSNADLKGACPHQYKIYWE